MQNLAPRVAPEGLNPELFWVFWNWFSDLNRFKGTDDPISSGKKYLACSGKRETPMTSFTFLQLNEVIGVTLYIPAIK